MVESGRLANILSGVCPNTGEACPELAELRASTQLAQESFMAGFGQEADLDAMSAKKRRALENARQRAAGRSELRIAAHDNRSCVGGCALAGADIQNHIRKLPDLPNG